MPAPIAESVPLDAPAPKSMAAQIAAMQIGDALAFPMASLNAVRVCVSRIRRQHPERVYTVGPSPEGPAVWRKRPTTLRNPKPAAPTGF